jgi:hypothetical protein
MELITSPSQWAEISINGPPLPTLLSGGSAFRGWPDLGNSSSLVRVREDTALQYVPDHSQEVGTNDCGLNDAVISQLRKFFELLDRWDRDARKVV